MCVGDACNRSSGLRSPPVIADLQCRDRGTFAGDEWGETDTRFLYGALNALSILGELDRIDMPKAIQYVQACANSDGGFGVCPGAESHAGQVFTCLGALSIARQLHLVDVERTAAWLSERQLPNGGFNGRPEKLEDVCYSWWVGSSLAMLGKLHWIEGERLRDSILRCQVGLPLLRCQLKAHILRASNLEGSLIGQRTRSMYSTLVSLLLD